MDTKIAQMETERRELDRKIRRAKRDQAKQEQIALEEAQKVLGIRLGEAHGSNTLEELTLLGDMLVAKTVQDYIEKMRVHDAKNADVVPEATTVDSSDTFTRDDEPSGASQQHDHDEPSWDSGVTGA